MAQVFLEGFYFESRVGGVFCCSRLHGPPDAVATRVAAVLRFPVYGREERT